MAGTRARIAFEATPDYLLDLNCAQRVVSTLGSCRIVVMVRDPVERAHSHYLHNRRLGIEPLEFDEALDREEVRLAAALEVARGEPNGLLPNEYLRFSYATRGRYAEQLEPWLTRFSNREVLVLHSQDLFSRPAETFLRITQFLGVSPWAPDGFKNYSYVGTPPPSRERLEMSTSARELLVQHFREPNKRLSEMLGRSFDWGR
jgi:hypothetical protein